MNEKVLIINNFIANLTNLTKREGMVDSLWITRKLNLLERLLFRTKFGKKLRQIRYADKKKWWSYCSDYEIIILIDSSKDIVFQTKKIEQAVSSDTRLILYMLNSISYTSDYNQLSGRWELWSFSKKESIENGFHYGETFYYKNFLSLKIDSIVKYDTFFVGREKGRLKILQELEGELKRLNLKFLFCIISDKNVFFSKRYSRGIPYSKVINLINESKSIVEIVQEKQEGMTLRAMESIFFKRKLITNNTAIKEKKIFCPENIFILGENNIDSLISFINTPYKEIDENEINKYEFSSWLKRIITNEEFEYDEKYYIDGHK